MPGTDRVEEPLNIATLETIQRCEFVPDLDSPLLASTSHRQGASPEPQVEDHAVRLILQRSLVPGEIGVIIQRDFLEYGQQRDRNHVIGGLERRGLQQFIAERDQPRRGPSKMCAGMVVNENFRLEPRREQPIRPARRSTEQKSSGVEMNADPFECAP
ncbi:unnamed protein product [marine sediment metagenome]|uniref:Uncharacterized protein n=1 Tax=marine sediment metagenome TaxID=412755 RepID=X1C295_9ZZZZ